MVRILKMVAVLIAMSLGGTGVAQDMHKFTKGPVFSEFGPVAHVETDVPVPPDTVFKVMFDVSSAADPGKLNRGLESAARFINMNVAAGVPEQNIHVAIVAHGPVLVDLARAATYAGRHKDAPGVANANEKLVAALIAHGVRIYVCGQSRAAMGLTRADLLPGVKLALSAMDAKAMLGQQGYVLVS